MCAIGKFLQNKEEKQARDGREQDKARVGQGVLLILSRQCIILGGVRVCFHRVLVLGREQEDHLLDKRFCYFWTVYSWRGTEYVYVFVGS